MVVVWSSEALIPAIINSVKYQQGLLNLLTDSSVRHNYEALESLREVMGDIITDRESHSFDRFFGICSEYFDNGDTPSEDDILIEEYEVMGLIGNIRTIYWSYVEEITGSVMVRHGSTFNDETGEVITNITRMLSV